VIEEVAEKLSARQVQRSCNDRFEIRLTLSPTAQPEELAEQVIEVEAVVLQIPGKGLGEMLRVRAWAESAQRADGLVRQTLAAQRRALPEARSRR
jgi:hypothetical protein